MTTESIGRRIRRLRLDAGLTQADLARLARCTNTTIGNIERNLVGCNIYTFIEIARVLGASLDYLVYGGRNGTDSNNA